MSIPDEFKTLINILEKILDDESHSDFINLLKKESFEPKDLIYYNDYISTIDDEDLKPMFEDIEDELICRVNLKLFIYEIIRLKSLFEVNIRTGKTVRKSIKIKSILNNIQKFLEDDSITEYEPQLSIDLIKNLNSFKNYNDQLMCSFIIYKIDTILIKD